MSRTYDDVSKGEELLRRDRGSAAEQRAAELGRLLGDIWTASVFDSVAAAEVMLELRALLLILRGRKSMRDLRDFVVDPNWVKEGDAIEPMTMKMYRNVRLMTGMVIARVSKQQGVMGYGADVFRGGQWQELGRFDTEADATAAIDKARNR